MLRTAVVIGGSIAGLFTASMLRKKGWAVDVFEKSPVELAGRGAGIVTHRALLDALDLCGAGTDDIGVRIESRTGYDRAGNVIRKFAFPQIVTSWGRLHALTRAIIPDAHYHLDHCFESYRQTGSGVVVRFSNGRSVTCDLLVGCDGFRSAVREQMHPHVQPEYAGYIVWRGVANEGELPPDIRANVFETFGFFLPARNEILGYPIAGPSNELGRGRRRYNWVWYRVVPPAELKDMLTDAEGNQYDLTIAPPLIRNDVIQKLRDDAEDVLAPPFRRILEKVEAPFFTPIYDHASPSMIDCRVALSGDAAFVARPHVGMGVTKAAEDARVLAEELERSPSIEAGLASFNSLRHRAGVLAYERGRHLGEFLMPGYTTETEKAEWARAHNVDTIMRDTAVADF